MARPRKFDEDAFLDAATEVFWTRGYDHTSVEDVSAATSVGNGSIYAAYSSKTGLFLAVLERYCDRRATFVEQVVDASQGSARDAARDFFEAIIADCVSQPDRRGCLMISSVAQLGHRVAEVVPISVRSTDRMERSLTTRLGAALDRDPAELSDVGAHLVLVSQGLIQLSRTGVPLDRLRDIAAVSIDALPASAAA